MAIAKRTQKEIEKDCKRLKEATKSVTSMKELEKATGLSYAMIKTTLSKHPTIFKRIKEQLAINKEKAEEEQKENVTNKQNEKLPGFVIDASIAGTKELKEILEKVCNSEAKIILTSITIKELKEMGKFEDKQAIDARYIIKLAAQNPNDFETVLIDETLDTPDDCIIKYCADNKANVTLLSSDGEMVLKARMHSIHAKYFEKPIKSDNSKNITHSKSRTVTLTLARRVGNKLLFSILETNLISTCVYSEGGEYNNGIRELKIGDDIFVSTKKPDYITFAHYKVTSLYAENNCELIYSKRFYDYNDINVPKDAYESFIKDFKNKHNL